MRIEDEYGNRALGGVMSAPLTPDSYLEDTLRSNLQAVQERFNQQWQTIQQNAEYIGIDKANALLQQLTLKGRDEVAQIQMQAQQKRDMLKRVTMLRDQGALNQAQLMNHSSVDEMMWNIAAGPEITKMMFPKVKGPQPVDPLDEYRDLTQQEQRIQSDLERFHVVPGGERQNRKFLPDWGMPVSTSKLRVFDPQVFDPKVNEIGAWVDSPTPVKHAKEMASLNKQLALVREAKQRLRTSPAIGARIRQASARLITGENPHGTIADKVSASVVMRQEDRPVARTQPTKKLDRATAQSILQEAGGDKTLARQIARQRGYEL